MDPFTIGLLSMFAANNPEQAGPMLTQMGLPVPKLTDLAGGAEDGTGGGGADPMQAQAQAQPAVRQPQMPNAPTLANAALQGVKPPAPIQPIMSGGVAGGVKPPEMTAKMGSGSPAIQSLMAALLGGGGHMPVPTLGEYIRGGKY